MTFSRANGFFNRCDCDECEDIPPSIRKFIENRKRQRRETGPIKRTQQRTLVSRYGGANLQCMHMPKHAEPLVDFGTSHRIVWVKRLVQRSHTENNGSNGNHTTGNGGSILQWIGKGIIGSSDEEKGRVFLDSWTEGSVFLVPSNGGKAIGWIHTNDTRNTTSDGATDATGKTNKDDSSIKRSLQSDSFAVLYVAKIPFKMIDQDQEESSTESYPDWVNALVECCRDCHGSCDEESNEKPQYYKLPGESSELLKKVIREVEERESKDDTDEPNAKWICRRQSDIQQNS